MKIFNVFIDEIKKENSYVVNISFSHIISWTVEVNDTDCLIIITRGGKEPVTSQSLCAGNRKIRQLKDLSDGDEDQTGKARWCQSIATGVVKCSQYAVVCTYQKRKTELCTPQAR